MNISFIGLGIMGSRMAANLQQNGYKLTVHNRTPDKATALINDGATWADTPAATAGDADILITMLAHPEAVMETALGADGFLDVLRPGTLWVDCSTVNPSFSRKMAEEATARQVRFLDAPVGGTKPHAAQGQLIFIVGGDEAALETVRPLFEVMGNRIVHVGSAGMGTALKVVVNYLLATSMAAFAEGMVLGQALGLPQELLFNVLIGGPVTAPFVAMKREKMAQGDYDAEFPLRWMQKDVHMAATAAYESGVALPVGNAAKELYRLADRQGLGQEDFSAIYHFLQGDQERSFAALRMTRTETG